VSQTDQITDIATLEALYGAPGKASLIKVADRMVPVYWDWIKRSRLCMLSTVGPEGTDCSPRGDDGPVVQMMNDKTLLMPDWRGNNRMDSLRNIITDGRVSLMFLVPGSNNVVRINGTAVVSIAGDLIGRFSDRGKLPRSVIVITVAEVYSQCARALMRAGTWAAKDESKKSNTMFLLNKNMPGEEQSDGGSAPNSAAS